MANSCDNCGVSVANKKGSKSRRGALGVALAAALTFLSRPSQPWAFYSLCALLLVSLLYGLSGWVTKPGLSFPERMGRGIALLSVVSVVVALYAWQFRPGWHLTGEQEDGIADAATKIPKDVVVLVELYENSPAGQDYGHDIMRVLKDNGARVNSITVFRGVGPTPVGIVVCAPHRGDLGHDIAGYLHWKMLTLHMPAVFAEDCPNVDSKSLILYVGSRPVE